MARHGARQVAITLGALSALGAIGALGALRAPGAAAQGLQPTPTFRSEIQYVQIPVRVLDARGEFVRRLTQSDFQIFEDGTSQTISTFSAIDIPFVRQTVASAVPPSAIDGAPSASQHAGGRAYAFVLDNQDMDEAIALRVRHLVRGFLTNHFAANDLATIVVTGVGQGQSLTQERHLLDAALERLTGDKQPLDQRIHQTATVIAETARSLESIQGKRKALVLVTASQVCTLEASTCRESLNHAVRVSGYVVGYRSTNTIADGKVRINKVTTSRKGVRVVHRRSYVAPAAASP
ncbi:MAG TPA: hypothetical protein VM115_10320 [Vicinamibacterales bacterium]|nr:hypothetical protein [Vicinamibacterales bacterium]